MKMKNRSIALVVSALLLITVASGCAEAEAPAEIIVMETPGEALSSPGDEVRMDISLEIVPLTAAPAVLTMLLPSAPGTNVEKNQKAEIDYSNKEDGYVMVRFLTPTNKQLRVLITGPSGVQYTYTLRQDGEFEVFPLSDLNGSYTIGVWEQVEGSRYAMAVSTTINVTLRNEFAPFLRPNQYVNFNENSRVVTKAAELVRGVNTMPQIIEAIYSFVVNNLTYDRNLAETVQSGYLPDVDAVLERGMGICFDYAALMAAMLRSQGIPTRLVVGYAGTAWHAWIDVYSEETGWINAVIFLDGEDWVLMDPTFASTGRQSESIMRFIGDGSNYSAKFLY